MKIKNFRFVYVITVLVLASLACATLIGDSAPEGQSEIQPDPTSAEVTALPTFTPAPTDEPPPTVDPALIESASIQPPTDLDNTFAPFWEVRELVHNNFVDQPVDDTLLMAGAIEGLQLIAETTGEDVDDATARAFAAAAGTPGNLVDTSLPFWKAWITTDAPQDAKLMRVAITGMLDSLGDQHTSYMDPDQFRQANIPLDGTYEGIGAWVDPNGEYLTIVSPMPDSPAEKAGLLPGDQVIAVDGEDMTGVDGNLVIRSVLGPAGTDVTLTILREDVDEPFDITITRGTIVIPSVTGDILEGDIAYIQLFQYASDTNADLEAVLTELMAQNPKGLILDLRNNGGGFLSTAIEVTSQFIGEGVIMYEVYGDGTRDTYSALSGGLATDIPMVILINEGTASASEITAGAIQDYGRAVLLGTTSFGKGSVQNWIPLDSENGAARITIARWYTPKEQLIHGIGLTPDIVVEITEADIEAGIDPQLDAAIALLLGE